MFDIKHIIKLDLLSHYAYPILPVTDEKIGVARFLKALLDIDFRAVFFYRIVCWLMSIRMKKTALMLYYRLKSVHGVDISPYADIAPGFKLVHAFNIVIGPEVSVGENSVCFNSVTLGNNRPGWKKRLGNKMNMPSIGARVILCPGARVVGDINISDDIVIGANQVISRSLENSDDLIDAKKSGLKVYYNK